MVAWGGRMLLLLSVTAAAAAQLPEAELKAAFIYNFALFTQWPPQLLSADGRLHLCVAQTSPLQPALARLADKPVNGRRLAVLTTPGDGDDLSACRIWLDEDAQPIGPASRYGVLTVADGAVSPGRGAIITLVVEDQHLRFDIDQRAAQAAGLRISSKLLRLARRTQ